MERRVRGLVRQAMPFLVPMRRRYVEWSYEASSRSRERLFTNIFRSNHWGGADSVSGGGSDLDQTSALRAALPGILQRLGVRSLLDAPCGDFHWMRRVDLPLEQYVGGDIVDDLVRRLQATYAAPGREFLRMDLTVDPLPRVDAILSRDCLVHFSFRQIDAAVRNFRRSGAVYLLTTTFTDRDRNQDIVTGDWRPLNLCAPPLGWPEPVTVINEGCTEGGSVFADKSLGVWELASLPPDDATR
ncbi:MAG TPA: class I SAM-dependent methyltransferase [Actinomycetota bacterium]